MLSAVLMWGYLLSGAASIDQAPAAAMSDIQRDQVGRCEGQGRSFDLRRLMMLENRTVDIDGPNGTLRVRLDEEHLFIDAVSGAATQTVFGVNIGDEIDPHEDLDVELKLGYFEGGLVVYWKETFQHRIYRQGLFSIEGERISILCVGNAGVTTTH